MVLAVLGPIYLIAQGPSHLSSHLYGHIQSASDSGAVIAGAMIMLVNESAGEEILSYTYAADDGSFRLKLEKYPPHNALLVVSAWGFERKVLPVDSLHMDQELVIYCVPKSFRLDEVLIKERNPVKQTTDTVSFHVAAYIDSTERNLEDIVEKLPGADVDGEGNISFGGKKINRILIEGDDLSGQDYKIVSQNMPAKTVRKVEFIYDYTENSLLAGFDIPEALIMNVQLDSASIQAPTGNVDLGKGNAKSSALNTRMVFFSPKLKSINILDYQSLGQSLYVPSDYQIEALNIVSSPHPVVNGQIPMNTFRHSDISVPLDLAPFRWNHTGWGQTRIHFKPSAAYRIYIEIGGGGERVASSAERRREFIAESASFAIDETQAHHEQRQTIGGSVKQYLQINSKSNLTLASTFRGNFRYIQSQLDLRENHFDIHTQDTAHVHGHKLVYLNRLNKDNILSISGSFLHKRGLQILGIQTHLPYYTNLTGFQLEESGGRQILSTALTQHEGSIRLIHKWGRGTGNIGLRYGHQVERLHQTHLQKTHISTQIKARYVLPHSWLLAMDLQPGMYRLAWWHQDRGGEVRQIPHIHGMASLMRSTMKTKFVNTVGFHQILPTVRELAADPFLSTYRSTQVGDSSLETGYRIQASSQVSYTSNLSPLKAFVVMGEVTYNGGRTPYQQVFWIDSLIARKRWEATPQAFQQLRVKGELHKYVHKLRTGFKLRPAYNYDIYTNQLSSAQRSVHAQTFQLEGFAKIVTPYRIHFKLVPQIRKRVIRVLGDAASFKTWTYKNHGDIQYFINKKWDLLWRTEYLYIRQQGRAGAHYFFHKVQTNYRFKLRQKQQMHIQLAIENLSNQETYGMQIINDVLIQDQAIFLRPRTFFVSGSFSF
ncbi:MAG: carboxypeptidase-like regulatory domain-containing protein [Bacteroidota bacterium]